MFSLEQRMLYSGCDRAFGSFSLSGSEESSVLALLNPFSCVLSWGVPASAALPGGQPWWPSVTSGAAAAGKVWGALKRT